VEDHSTQHEQTQTQANAENPSDTSPQNTPDTTPETEHNDSTIEGMIGADEPLAQEGMQWFVLRVASNKENSVQNTLLRKIQIEGMTHLVGRILVPTEKIKTIKGGKAKIKEEKLYAGYVFVEMKLEDDGRIPQDIFFLIKETTGVGDFIGTAGRPTPMQMHEVEKMLLDSRKPEEEPTDDDEERQATARQGQVQPQEADGVLPLSRDVSLGQKDQHGLGDQGPMPRAQQQVRGKHHHVGAVP